jgi:uncharacterized membrane protein
MLALLFILSAADIATTVIGLNRGLTELNPIARKLFGVFGTLPAAIGLKLIGLALFAYLLHRHPALWPVAGIYCLLLAGVVLNNVLELRDAP